MHSNELMAETLGLYLKHWASGPVDDYTNLEGYVANI